MRILPEMCPRMTCPFSSFTRKVALGSVSMISPCIWITSSLAIFSLYHPSLREDRRSLRLPGRKTRAFEVGFLEQALVLVRHDVRLHLRHEIHGHDDDDQQRCPAEIKRYVPPQDQKLGQQADQGDVYGPRQRQSQEDLFQVLRRLLPGADAGNESARLLQIVGG